MTREQVETALDRGALQASFNGSQWYDIRRNGATKTWKRDPNKVEIPCKVGFKECFRLCGENEPGAYYGTTCRVWRWDRHIRVRPDNFDPRKRI